MSSNFIDYNGLQRYHAGIKSKLANKANISDLTNGTITVSKATTAATATSAGRLTNGITITLSDNNGSHTQNNTGITLSGATTLKLPGTITGTLVGNASSATVASKTSTSLTLQFNGGTTEGTSLYTFNGSSAKSINIAASTPISLSATSSKITLSHATSGVTAGTYGDGSNQTPSADETFNVPDITVDSTGHITNLSLHTVKMYNTGKATQVENTSTINKIIYINGYDLSDTSSLYYTKKAYIDYKGNITATSFNGNASSATKLLSIYEAQNPGNRAIWFSDSGTPTIPNYDNDFVYNPVTNTLTLTNGVIQANSFKGSLTGNASSANALTTNAGSSTHPVYFSNGVPVATGTSLSITADAALKLKNKVNVTIKDSSGSHSGSTVQVDGSSAITLTLPSSINATLREHDITWDNVSIAGSLSPIDVVMTGQNANRFSFLPASCITVEYSNNAGATWTDYGATDETKINLVSYNDVSLSIGKKPYISGSGRTTTVNDQLRITFSASNSSTYCNIRNAYIWLTTNGASGCKVTVSYATYAADTTFVTLGTWSISGWSGWNVIPMSGIRFGGGHYKYLRFTFTISGLYSGTDLYSSNLTVEKMLICGESNWVNPSNLAKSGHLYTWDYKQNALFPANISASGSVTATSFEAVSARSKKRNIIPTTHVNAIDEINKIDIVDFNYKMDKDNYPHIGFIADDTDEIFSSPKHDVMDMGNCIGMLLKAVQELSNKVKLLEEKLK